MLAYGAEAGLPGDAKVVVADSAERIAEEIVRQRPRVVVNTIGDYAATAAVIARACMPGGHYVDQANDLSALDRLLGLHDEAARAGSTLVTGAGFGCWRPRRSWRRCARATRAAPGTRRRPGLGGGGARRGRRRPRGQHRGRTHHRRAAVRRRAAGDVPPRRRPAAAHPPGRADGEVGGCPVRRAARGARGERGSVRHRHLRPRADRPAGTRAAAAARPSAVRSGTAPVRRRPDRPDLGQGRSPAARALLGHAVVEWADGTRREGWLRAGEGMDFTTDVTATVAARLLQGEARPGAWTPAAAFGPDLATAAGGTFVLD
ncbi:hypothetical protein NKH77_04770 [Streptomyces sp. M19]